MQVGSGNLYERGGSDAAPFLLAGTGSLRPVAGTPFEVITLPSPGNHRFPVDRTGGEMV